MSVSAPSEAAPQSVAPASIGLVWARTALASGGWLLGCAAVAVIGIVALGLGRYAIEPLDVIRILLSRIGFIETDVSDTARRVVVLVRAPRILSAALAGAILGMTGAALQGIFRNPLVGPQIIGVTSGASFGGALAILLVGTTAATVGFAFVFGLVAVFLVYTIARVGGRAPVLMLVLAGVVVSAAFTAFVSLIKYVADPNDTLPAIVYWLMGSFATATYDKLFILTLAVLGSVLVLHALRFRINIMSLGEEEATALGIRVEPTRWAILAAVALGVAGVVSVAGVVGWVGLVMPHLARMIVGPDHRKLLPAAALAGAGYLIIVDTLARTMSAAEIPIGILTALVGAPVFAVLLRRLHLKGWGRG
ncbi:MAG: FecCD family ABC transporter permease [Cohaesibacteraceae bacterium]